VLHALARIPSEKAVRVRHAGGEDGTAASAEYAARLRRLAKELGVEGRIDWLGEIADMRPFYAEVDCLISSSRREPNSIAVLEAAAAGIPVLASDASTTGDLVARAGLGRVFAADSPDALAAQMTEFASDGGWGPPRRDEGALAAFTAPVAAQAHLEVYRLLIAA
jgi:glycosyltransferase involved in cell wall biosynthesis